MDVSPPLTSRGGVHDPLHPLLCSSQSQAILISVYKKCREDQVSSWTHVRPITCAAGVVGLCKDTPAKHTSSIVF